MAEGWHSRFKGEIDGRFVELEVYEPSGELRVRTTQATNAQTDTLFEPGTNLFPTSFVVGDAIDISGEDADDLERNLIEDGFTDVGAKQITRIVRLPSN